MTQNERVLLALRQAGSRGIDQTDFDLPITVDGGAPIKRVAARIQDLEDRGCIIGTPSKRHGGCTVYVLHQEPVTQQPPTRTGGVQSYVCKRCLGFQLRRSEICAGSEMYPASTHPAQVFLAGCRIEQVRAERARRQAREVEEVARRAA